ncbi:hypothetical protein DL93DRAFT_216749 [Clavulina sp. PMI_390]|nr:hypothetical protein DL93DRAFT_216749 [Clavulina sp. PMI_390]
MNNRLDRGCGKHPDLLYQAGAAISSACHSQDPKPRKGDRADPWGTHHSDCDSPLRLYNHTMDWIEKEWANEVDFVIWTGDNARHDNDPKHPRTPAEIYELNTMVANRMASIFTSKGIPVVPSIGNNDIWPHNIMYAGPSTITNKFVGIWTKFIPFESYQIFQRGAYYSVELIPNKLGALSLNTLYWYEKNSAVEGCKKGQPGRLELDWLGVQLEVFRGRGMQVWLSGHVGPSLYFPDCRNRYAELVLRYQDTIVGQLFGHMNVDHFYWIDKNVLQPEAAPSNSTSLLSIATSSLQTLLHAYLPHSFSPTSGSPREDVGILKKDVSPKSLSAAFNSLPKQSKLDLDAFSSIINVGPSVVTVYYPAIRVFTYNVTGLANDGQSISCKASRISKLASFAELEDEEDDVVPQKQCRIKKAHTDPNSPSRTNSALTPLGYSQFVIDKLDLKASQKPRWNLEYMTYDIEVLNSTSNYPVPSHLIPSQLFNNSTILSASPTHSIRDASAEDLAPFGLRDLTIPSYLRLARQLGKASLKKKKLWTRFVTYMYMAF